MFFTECARLAEQHPDLAGVLEKLDCQLRAMGTAEVIRADDLASYLTSDPNQMRSALDMFAQAGVLDRVEMIECTHCQMAVLRSEYQVALEEDDEYRCTSCDRQFTDRTVQIITAYRRGEKWRGGSSPETLSPPNSLAGIVSPAAVGVAQASRRGRGFPANASDHRKVATAVAGFGEGWMEKLPDVCRELHRVGAALPTYWREIVETWEGIADAVDGAGKSADREKTSAHIRYRINWVRRHPLNTAG
jgi:hypothetical protein